MQFTEEVIELTRSSGLDEQEKHELLLQLSDCRIIAGNIAKVALRPMTLTLFGQSQAGKSYLVSEIAGGTSQDFRVLGGNGKTYDFLTEITPPGGDESTAQVTRFTRVDDTARYVECPVHIRLMSPSDLAKIFANGFAFECSHPDPPSPEALGGPQDFTRTMGGNSQGFSDLELFDIERYVRGPLGDCLYFRQLDKAGFWNKIHQHEIGGQLEQQVEYLSHLWGRSHGLTNLFQRLLKALKQLNCEDLWVEEECLFPVQESIIYVKPLKKNLRLGQDAKVRAKDSQGKGFNIPRSMLSALTAELVLRVPADDDHKLLEQCDILDFPGARERGGKFEINPLDTPPKDGESDLLAEIFLRGKVGYLFERYTELRDISNLVLCSPHEQPQAISLPPLVQQWIHQTHGRTPEERNGKKPMLYVAFTKFDRTLEVTAGLPPQSPARWDTRLQTHFETFFSMAGDPWAANWDYSGPFKNCFWVRNPNADQVFFKRSSSGEWIVDPDRVEELGEIAAQYMINPLVTKHFPKPQESWDAVATPDWTGVEVLLESIVSHLSPEQRRFTLHGQLSRLLQSLENVLKKYSESQSAELASQEAESCRKALESFSAFGIMLDALSIRESNIEPLFKKALDFHGGAPTTAKASHGSGPLSEWDDLAGLIFGDGVSPSGSGFATDGETSGGAVAYNPAAAAFADDVINHWESLMASAWSDGGVGKLGAPKKCFDKLRGQILIGARTTYGIAQAIAKGTECAMAMPNPASMAKYHALVVACIVNNYLNWLGGVPIDVPEPGRKAPKVDANPFAGKRYHEEWLKRMEDLFVSNAGGTTTPGPFMEFAARVKAVWDDYRPRLDK
jgi:hypothetical protein